MSDTPASSARMVRCPQCGKPSLYSPENPSRPFCSARCRTNDLGAWADETYRIPVGPASSDSLTSDGGDDSDDDSY